MTQEQERDRHVARVLADVRRVQRSRGERDRRGVFWAEGVRQFLQAVDGGFEIENVVVSRVLLRGAAVEKLIRELGKRGVKRVSVKPEEFRLVCLAERASGIGAIVRQRWTEISAANAGAGICWVVIEEIRLPGNLGTILRTAEAVGAAGVFVLSERTDVFDPGVVRASMGGVFHLQLVRCSHEEFSGWAKSNGLTEVGLSHRSS
jgi:RNA methyltransferase, TrmH family